MRDFRLRPMTAADLPAVLAVERASQPVPWTEGMLRDSLRDRYWCRVAVDARDAVLAFAILSEGGGDAHLLNIAVAPAARRRGIARHLVEELVEEARRREATHLFLEVREGNEPALTLYRDLGFAEVGLRRGYYPRPGGGREDAVVMARTL